MPLPRPSRLLKQEKSTSPKVPLEKKDFRPSDVFRFDPKPDITADELAYLVSIFWTLDVTLDRFQAFTSDLQRHFRVLDD